MEKYITALQSVGMNALEARAYLSLIQSGPMTAYAVAKALGKTAPQVYKAVESLVSMGAVELTEGKSRICQAVPVEQLLELRASEYTRRLANTRQVLDELPDANTSDGIVRIERADRVLLRARAMLDEASGVVLIDGFPTMLDLLAPWIERAASRPELFVGVKAYEPIELGAARVSVMPSGLDMVDAWPGSWLNIVSDANQLLISLFSPNGDVIHDAFYTRNNYVAMLYHNGLSAEICMDVVEPHLGAVARQPLDHWREALFRAPLPTARAIIESLQQEDPT